MNKDLTTSGLARVQSESRIPANTWRGWCDRLNIDPDIAVELWDDVCHPMMLASGKAPDLALILQLRAARPDVSIDDFRDELPAVLLSTTFVDCIRDEGRGAVRGALLRLYRYLGSRTGESVGRVFLVHAATLSLLEAVLPEDLTLPKLIKVLCAGKGTLDDLCRLGRRALTDDPRGAAVGEALDAGLELLHPTRPEHEEDDNAVDSDDADAPASDSEEDDSDEGGDEDFDADRELDDDESMDEDGTPVARAPGPQELYMETLRAALTVVCVDKTVADPAQREARLQSIVSFNPLGSRIPTIEEAQQRMNQRVDLKGEGRRHALENSRRSQWWSGSRAGAAGGGSASSGSAGGGGGSTASASPSGGTAPASATDATDATDADGKLPVPTISRNQLDESVQTIAAALTKVRELDERIWLLFIDAELELETPRALAEELTTADSSAALAGAALRQAAQLQRVRSILQFPPEQRERRFDLEAEAWLNTVANYRRAYEPDSRQLISLPTVLDHAASALVRVEALRCASQIVRDAESEEEITIETVTDLYETLLSDITCLADSDLMTDARQRADVDATAVLAAIAADAWIEHVHSTTLAWMDAAIESGSAASIEAATSAVKETPLQIDPPSTAPVDPDSATATAAATDPEANTVEPTTAAASEGSAVLSEALSADSPLGEIVDTLRVHALRSVWKVLCDEYHPQETTEKLDLDLRRRLRAFARITPRRERHQRNPRVSLPVASLERLSGNPALSHLFVRLSTDGKLLFIEDYEDGSYIDLYELRESTKQQMHGRAQDRARTSNTGELQKGSSYLLTLGRSNDPFAPTEQQIMAACVVNDAGERVIFDG